jgi:hypothetical protein
MESNWVVALPGTSWFPILRRYGPLEAWFERTGTLDECRRIDDVD